MFQHRIALMFGIEPDSMLCPPVLARDGATAWLWEGASCDAPKWSADFDALGFVFEGDLRRSLEVARIAEMYLAEIEVATARWRAFAAWMRENHQVELPEASVLLVRLGS